MITQGPFTLTLGTTLPLNDPGATSNNPATQVQLQNATAFIIEVNVGGAVYTIQSFTAQTVPTSGGGQQMAVSPLESTGGGGGTLTVVWLLAGEQSPMQDGPLTAAAIAAANPVPTAVFGPASVTASGGGTLVIPSVPITPSTRTLIVRATGGGMSKNAEVLVVGNQSGYTYYDNPSYLSTAAPSGPFVIIPITAPLDTTVSVTIATTGPSGTVAVYSDTIQYDESVFYNGTAVATSLDMAAAGGPTTFLTGPARLLTASLQAFGGAAGVIQLGGQKLLQLNSDASGQSSNETLTFPDDTILPANDTIALLQGGSGNTTAMISFAYP